MDNHLDNNNKLQYHSDNNNQLQYNGQTVK